MARLSEKYAAGFLDADGSVSINWGKTTRDNREYPIMRPYLVVRWSQLTKHDEMLSGIKDLFGGSLVYKRSVQMTSLRLDGKNAMMALQRILKYMVIKKRYAETLIKFVQDGKTNVLEGKKFLKEQRQIKETRMPNYPSRKWLAGYFDGDGCLQVRLPKSRHSAQITAEIACSDYDSIGIELIQKVFGGSICDMDSRRPHIKHWVLTMPPSKAKEFLGYFKKHLIRKKEQADFIMGCARMGHFRDGERIRGAMKQLKTQPHRLNEPKADIGILSKDIRDLSRMEIKNSLWTVIHKPTGGFGKWVRLSDSRPIQ